MSKVKEFYDAMAKDEAMQGRAKKAVGDQRADKDAAVAKLVDFAGKEGYSFTADEMKEYLSAQKKSGEIGDDVLGKVAGGWFWDLWEWIFD